VTNSFLYGVQNKNAITAKDAGGGIQHLYFTNSILYGQTGGNVFWASGGVLDVRITNCLIITYSAITILNLTGGEAEEVVMTDSTIELNGGNDQSMIYVGIGINNYMLTVAVTDTYLNYATHLVFLVNDASTDFQSAHNIVFERFSYDGATLRTHSAGNTVNLIFRDCFFHTPTNVALAIETVGGDSYIGQFINCVHVNPVGKMSQPFAGVNDDWMYVCLASSWSRTSSVVASKNYTIRDVDVLMTSTGGTGVSITIWDASGNAVLTGLSTLNRTYLPIGYKVNFGGFSGAPTVVVEGL
jgi:hypothetical protein